MITLAINWGYALLVTGVGMVTVFLLLILLIWIINLQTKLTNQVEDHAKNSSRHGKSSSDNGYPSDTSRTSCHRHGYASIFQLS